MNKQQIIHWVVEFITLISLVIYVTISNKKLSNKISELNQKLELHENLLKSHDEILKKMLGVTISNPVPVVIPVEVPSEPKTEKIDRNFEILEEDNEELTEESESDLEAEIEDELNELKSEEVAMVEEI